MPNSRSMNSRALWGWLSYAFASEVFAVCSLTLFLPICLEQFARDNGFLLPDKTIHCPRVGSGEDARCVVKLGWIWVDSASYSLYVYSASVAIQALTVVSLGGLADSISYRKRILLSFAFTGSLCSFVFLTLPSSSPFWTLSALLAIIANVSFGASVVSLNAYLPTLASSNYQVQEARQNLNLAHHRTTVEQTEIQDDDTYQGEDRDTMDETSPLRSSEATSISSLDVLEAEEKYNTLLSRTTSRISSQGIAIGYAAGIILLLIILIPVTALKGSTFSLRLAISITGLWWALFSIPAAVWLPGGSPSGEGAVSTLSITTHITEAWVRIAQMLHPSEIKRLRNTFWFLLAWFLLSDGFTTITSTALLFAKTTLNMPASSLILIGALTPSAGILGAILFPNLQRQFGWSNVKVLILLVAMACVIPVYGCLGFLPLFKGPKDIEVSRLAGQEKVHSDGLRFGGLTTPGEMYVLACYFGSIYGAFQSYARAVFSELVPPGEEARWFGLYSITDKSSSFLGPLVVGLIADATGNIRYAFFFLILMVASPIPVLWWKVDVQRGREDSRLYAQVRSAGEISDC